VPRLAVFRAVGIDPVESTKTSLRRPQSGTTSQGTLLPAQPIQDDGCTGYEETIGFLVFLTACVGRMLLRP